LVTAQGGDVSYIDNPDKLPKAQFIETIVAHRTGYLSQIHARMIGNIAVKLGGGRAKKSDPIDHAVGIILHHKVGDQIASGESLFTVHANDKYKLAEAKSQLLRAHQWSDSPVNPLPLFYGIVK
jgi:pyrimidine-nucleoside phosphorylase